MLKKITKPSTNSLKCVDMMMQGAKKRRMMAYTAINSINSSSGNSTKVIMLR